VDLKLFTDLIEALGKVAKGVKSISDIPKSEREKYRAVLDETYRLIDTTLNMVIIRLGDIQAADDDQDFMDGVAGLDNYSDWMHAEREFRLCKSLRVVLRETETLSGRLAGALSTADWQALLDHMRRILATEGEVAEFIGAHFHGLADAATRPDGEIRDIKANVSEFRDAIIRERQELIRQEISLLSIV